MVNIEHKTEKPRLSAEDWAHAALDVIAEQGLAAVAVEPLARRLGVTKGSFYWHFPSREALLVAALQRWEKTEQETVFGKMEGVSDPRVRLRELFQLVAHAPKTAHHLFRAAQGARPSGGQAGAGPGFQRRMDYLTASFRQAGMPRQEAQNRARLAYAAYVGFLQLVPAVGPAALAPRGVRGLRQPRGGDLDSGASRLVLAASAAAGRAPPDFPFQAPPGAHSMSSQLAALNRWVESVANLTQPDSIHWCDGSDDENAQLIEANARHRRPGQAQRTDPSRLLPAPLQPVGCRARRAPDLRVHADCGRRGPEQPLDGARPRAMPRWTCSTPAACAAGPCT